MGKLGDVRNCENQSEKFLKNPKINVCLVVKARNSYGSHRHRRSKYFIVITTTERSFVFHIKNPKLH